MKSFSCFHERQKAARSKSSAGCKHPALRAIFVVFLLLGIGFHAVAQSNISLCSPSNRALAFDGVNDFVRAANASSLVANTPGITLTAWVYPTNPNPSFPNFDGFAGIRNEQNADFYLLQFTANDIEARFRNSSGQDYTIVSPVLNLNTWVHLALTYDGSYLRLYKNGLIADSLTASGTITNQAVDLLIGNLKFQTYNYYLQGRVDEVSLWSRALSRQEVRCIPVDGINVATASGLKLYYRFNQGTIGGNNAGITQLTDEAGNLNGSLNNFALNGTTSNFVSGDPLLNNLTLCAPTVACYQTATWNYSTCQWDVTGTQPPAPTGLAPNQTVQFDNSVCAWTVTTSCGSAISDVDGNSYNTLQLGNQCWTKSDLKTSKYRNGNTITNVTSGTTWSSTTSGAWCNYNNNTANDAVYGKLYNWYAVNDSRGVCPTGWSVPSDAQWTTLTDFLGGAPVAGGKMKSTTGWNSPNTGATNSSGFTALPGGYRQTGGSFSSLGVNVNWWSSSLASTSGQAWDRYIDYDKSSVIKGDYGFRGGLSVRCVRTVCNPASVPKPTGTLPCYQNYVFYVDSCQWIVSGTQPPMPSLECYETATFVDSLCQWVVTGSPNVPIDTTISACDSYTWSVNGETYTASGNYSDTINCQEYVLNLTINTTGTQTASITACNSYTWGLNGLTYSQSGSYTSVNACTTNVLNLTVIPGTSNTTTASACDSYTWSVNGQTYTQSGSYTSLNGCNAEILNLTISLSGTNTTNASACDSYFWSVNGQTYTQSGSYTSVSGCGTDILNLTVSNSSSNTTTASACDNYTWTVNGQTYTQSGSYTSIIGCATEILNLSVATSSGNTATATACDSYTWTVNSQTYTQSGMYTSVSGCTTDILNLTISASGSNTTTASACDSYTWTADGQSYEQSGTYTTVNGCVTEILNLTIAPSGTDTTTVTACGSYNWSVSGQTYTQSGVYTSVSGCGTKTLDLTIITSSTNTTTASACDSYTWTVNGQTYTQNGSYTSVSGCATEILNLTITPSTTNTSSETATSSYTWAVNGQTYSQSGTYTSVQGCATEVLNLTISTTCTPTPQPTIACYETATWNTTTCQWDVTGSPAPPIVTTITDCAPYVWSVDGQSYTSSGNYYYSANCQDYVLNLTINTISSYYVDTDGDGYGVGAAVSSCTPIPGYATISGDCDDQLSAVNPGATELCNGIDDNCDGTTDDTSPISGGVISGPSQQCIPIAAGSASFTVSGMQGASSYAWTVPNGMSISSGQGTSTINVTWTSSAAHDGIIGEITVIGSSTCGSGNPILLDVSMNYTVPVRPSSISGPAKVCPGDVATYSTALVARAHTYSWTVPIGMTIVSGLGTNVINVSVNSSYTGGSVTCSGINACGTGPARDRSVSLIIMQTPTGISGPSSGLCGTNGVTYSIAAVPGANSYSWTVPAGATITAGQGTNSVTVNFSGLFASGNVAVAALNACGSGGVRSMTVNGAPGQPSVISGPAAMCANQNYNFSINTVVGASTYNWAVPNGFQLISGQGNKDIVTKAGPNPASSLTISVRASNGCGTSVARSQSGLSILLCPRIGVGASMNALVYPNPVDELLNVSISIQKNQDILFTLTDVAGRQVLSESINILAGSNTIQLPVSSVASGVYTLQLRGKEQFESIRVVIE